MRSEDGAAAASTKKTAVVATRLCPSDGNSGPTWSRQPQAACETTVGLEKPSARVAEKS